MTSTVAVRGQDLSVMSLTGFAHAVSHFYQLALPAAFPFIRADLGTSFTELGAMLTLFYVTSALAHPASGWLVDRIGAAAVLIGGTALFSLMTMAYALVTDVLQLAPLVVLAAIGNSVFHPADYSILSARVSESRLGRAYGVHNFAGNLGFAAASVSVLLLSQTHGWRIALPSLGLIGLMAAAVLFALRRHLVPEAPRLRRAGGDEDSGAITSLPPTIVLPALLSFSFFLLIAAAQISLQSFMPVSLRDLYGTPLAAGSLAVTWYLVGAAFGVLSGGWLIDLVRRPGLLIISGLVGAAAILLALSVVPFPPVLLQIVAAVAGFLMGLTISPRDYLVRTITPKAASGRVFGLVYSGLDVGAAIAPIAVGALIDHGLSGGSLQFAAGAMLLCVGSAVLLARSASRT